MSLVFFCFVNSCDFCFVRSRDNKARQEVEHGGNKYQFKAYLFNNSIKDPEIVLWPPIPWRRKENSQRTRFVLIGGESPPPPPSPHEGFVSIGVM